MKSAYYCDIIKVRQNVNDDSELRPGDGVGLTRPEARFTEATFYVSSLSTRNRKPRPLLPEQELLAEQVPRNLAAEGNFTHRH